MKNTATTIVSMGYKNELEKMIDQKDAKLKEMSRNKAKHNAKRNLPEPNKSGQTQIFTGDIKAGYEELISFIYQYNQPEAHLPESQMDGALAKEQIKKLDTEIKKLDDQNKDDERELGNQKPANLKPRIRNALLLTAIIGIGEIVFNTLAFQVIGDNLLFSLILSTSVTVAAFLLAHIAALQYKNAETQKKKYLIIGYSLLIASGVFVVMAYFRSEYMAKNDLSTNPITFFVLNISLFIVTALLSYYLMPSWKEITENQELEDMFEIIEKRKKEIERIEKEKNGINIVLVEKDKQRSRKAYDTEYTVNLIQKKYKEAVAIYKCENIDLRKDGKVPVCFSEKISPIEVNNPIIHYQLIKEN